MPPGPTAVGRGLPAWPPSSTATSMLGEPSGATRRRRGCPHGAGRATGRHCVGSRNGSRTDPSRLTTMPIACRMGSCGSPGKSTSAWKKSALRRGKVAVSADYTMGAAPPSASQYSIGVTEPGSGRSRGQREQSHRQRARCPTSTVDVDAVRPQQGSEAIEHGLNSFTLGCHRSSRSQDFRLSSRGS